MATEYKRQFDAVVDAWTAYNSNSRTIYTRNEGERTLRIIPVHGMFQQLRALN